MVTQSPSDCPSEDRARSKLESWNAIPVSHMDSRNTMTWTTIASCLLTGGWRQQLESNPYTVKRDMSAKRSAKRPFSQTFSFLFNFSFSHCFLGYLSLPVSEKGIICVSTSSIKPCSPIPILNKVPIFSFNGTESSHFQRKIRSTYDSFNIRN